MSEHQVLEEILKGDREQFRWLVEANNELLYRTGMSFINNQEEVEDLMQVTYLKAFENLEKFREQSSFRTWITRIMINECLMYRRRNKRAVFADYDPNTFSNIPDGSSFESSLDDEELKTISEKMISKLQEDYRIVFVLREVQNFSTKEVAEAVGISEDNVKIKLHRAKKILQKMILSYIGEAEIFPYHKSYCNLLTARVMSIILSSNTL